MISMAMIQYTMRSHTWMRRGLAFVGITLPAALLAGQVLPVHEVPASTGKTVALFVSGDGGWVSFDRDVAAGLAARGVAVIGLDAKAYLSERRTPEQVAEDAAGLLRRYLDRWGRERIALIGYSRGAVIVPFVANRLPADLRSRLDLVAMMGLGYHAGFHVSLLDLLHTTTNPKDPPVAPELEAIHRAGIPMLCVYGVEEEESLCRDAPDSLIERIARAGGHHFSGDRDALARLLADRLGRATRKSP